METEFNRTLLTSYLDDFARRGNEVAFAHYDGLRVKPWSYLDIAQTASQVARELDARGIGKGDRVLLWARNSSEWVATFFGCLLKGVVVVPLDMQSEHGFVLRVQDQVTAKLLFTDHPTNALKNEIPVINLSQLTELLAHHSSARYPTSNASIDDVVEIVFTSGTTAEPKGVSLTHRNMLANLNPLEEETRKYLKWEPLVHPIRFLNLVPLSHVFGQLMGIFIPQLIRGNVFFQESLLPSRVIETVRRERISVIVSVPRILETLRDRIEREHEARNLLAQFHRKLAQAKESHFLINWWRFRRSFAFAGELMDQGFSILVFPEGTRTEHGRMNPFRPGTGLLISQLNTAVVPLRLDGLWELKKANRHFAKAGEVMVTIGKPIRYSSRTAPQAIAVDLETKVNAL